MITQLTQISRSLASRSKEILAVIVSLLFFGNYYICEFFYADDLENWWELRTEIYAVIFGLCFQIAIIGATKWLRFILSFGLGLSVSDIIDRVFFDITVFTTNDYVIIGLTLLTSIYNLCRTKK